MAEYFRHRLENPKEHRLLEITLKTGYVQVIRPLEGKLQLSGEIDYSTDEPRLWLKGGLDWAAHPNDDEDQKRRKRFIFQMQNWELLQMPGNEEFYEYMKNNFIQND